MKVKRKKIIIERERVDNELFGSTPLGPLMVVATFTIQIDLNLNTLIKKNILKNIIIYTEKFFMKSLYGNYARTPAQNAPFH